MNWWAITVISFWICGSLTTILTKDETCLYFSLVATVFAGIFYLMLS